jgi:hypothetical protein
LNNQPFSPKIYFECSVIHAIWTYIKIVYQTIMKNKLAWIYSLNDIAATIAKQMFHVLILHAPELGDKKS